MATIRKRNTGSWEIIFRRKQLFIGVRSFTFDTEKECLNYEQKIEPLLKKGVIPADWDIQNTYTVGKLINMYVDETPFSAPDEKILKRIKSLEFSNLDVKNLNPNNIDSLILDLKVKYKLSPETIRKKIGALRRVMTHHLRKKRISENHFLNLSRNYGNYSSRDIELAGTSRMNTPRSRRLEKFEEIAIRHFLNTSDKNSKHQESIEKDPVVLLIIFELALNTGMRLSEIYTLQKDQIDLMEGGINLLKTKNGTSRKVPVTDRITNLLEHYMASCEGQALFGHRVVSDSASSRFSKSFARIFKKAGVKNLHFHDLRHEAICRYFTHSTLSETEIGLIVGHLTKSMLQRYANLRISELRVKITDRPIPTIEEPEKIVESSFSVKKSLLSEIFSRKISNLDNISSIDY